MTPFPQQNRKQRIRNGAENMTERMHEQDKKSKKTQKKDRRRGAVIVTLLLVFAALLGTFAWYTISSQREIDSEKKNVMVPYFLYLKNATDESSLNFSVGNLHPGQTLTEAICVTNKVPDDDKGNVDYEISRESKFEYELELAYTENLPVNYKVYELREDENGNVTVAYKEGDADKEKKFSKISDLPMQKTDNTAISRNEVFGTGTDLSNVVNKGIYDSYTKGGADGNEPLTLTTSLVSDGTVVYDKDFYLIEISWKDGIDFSKYTKETDLVNVIVRALQPKPSEKAPEGN